MVKVEENFKEAISSQFSYYWNGKCTEKTRNAILYCHLVCFLGLANRSVGWEELCISEHKHYFHPSMWTSPY